MCIRDRYYVEAAHIQGLGRPDNGHDVAENMVPLCPNHHKQFDGGVLFLEMLDAQSVRIGSNLPGDALDGVVVNLKVGHTLDAAYVDYHRKHKSGR